MAFVRADEYELKIGVAIPPGEVRNLPGYERAGGQKAKGAILEFRSLPKDVKYEKVKNYSDSARSYEVELLPSSRVFRQG